MASKDGPYYDSPLAFRGQPSVHIQAAALKEKDANLKSPVHDDTYGHPVAGSKTEYRGKQADIRIGSEIVELCRVIEDLGKKLPDNTYIINFRELFQAYTRISNKLVGVLMRARKQNLIEFEGEMLFQRRDDHVQIRLIKKSTELEEDIQRKKDILQVHPGNIHKQDHSSFK